MIARPTILRDCQHSSHCSSADSALQSERSHTVPHDSWQNLIAVKFCFAELKPKIAESKKIEELSKNFILVNLEVGVRLIYEAINNNYLM